MSAVKTKPPASKADNRAILAERESINDALIRLQDELTERQAEFDEASEAFKANPSSQKALTVCGARLTDWQRRTKEKEVELEQHIERFKTTKELLEEDREAGATKFQAQREARRKPILAKRQQALADLQIALEKLEEVREQVKAAPAGTFGASFDELTRFDRLVYWLTSPQAFITNPAQLVAYMRRDTF